MRKRRKILERKNICPVCGKREKMANYCMCDRCKKVHTATRTKIKEMMKNVK